MVGAASIDFHTRAGAGEQTGAPPDRGPPWRTLPPTPRLVKPDRSNTISIGGAPIYYAQYGKGEHVIMLHGGLANSNYWAYQVEELSKLYTVTLMDTRGHGRSPFVGSKLGYNVFAADVIQLMDHLQIKQAALIGWSDGAITGLLAAIAAPSRVRRLYAFGANVSHAGSIAGGSAAPTFRAYGARCATEYKQLSPRPERWPQFRSALLSVWRSQPDIPPSFLHKIVCPTVISDGQHDEIIEQAHTFYIAKQIPHAEADIIFGTSHFAMLQDPAKFNKSLFSFLDP